MKKTFTPYWKTLTMAAFILSSLLSCQQSADTPSLSCPGMTMIVKTAYSSHVMQLKSNVIFRQHTDSGGIKFMSAEAVSDSLKIILNLRDGMFDEAKMNDDSLHLITYSFKKGMKKDGLVVAALKMNGGYNNYLDTDTSSITLTKMNLKTQTVSGRFYLKTANGEITGNGTFENACYTSLD